jgi:CHAD domain-containing protein
VLTAVRGVAYASDPETQILDAVYYDTADLRLLGDGVTLRRRAGGDDAGWHLKLPAGRDTRDEVRLPPGGDDVPAALAGLVRARTRGAPLVPVVRMRTTRELRRLLDDRRRTLAEVAVDSVTALPLVGPGTDAAWQEIEVELVGGGRKLLHAIDARLTEAGARPAAASSKLERVLAARLPARPAPVSAASTAGAAVLAYVGAQARAIAALDPGVRRDEPDAVHQMRVAIRRTRSTLRTFGPLLDRDRTREVSAELKWLAGSLAAVRDGEITAARVRAGLGLVEQVEGVGIAGARVEAYFGRAGTAARAGALRGLDGERYLAVLEGLDGLVGEGAVTKAARRAGGAELPAMVGRAYRRLARDVARARDGGGDLAVHDARKAAKRARYAAEAAGPVLGKGARKLVRRMRGLQDLLGEHHDSVVARAAVREIAAEARAAGEDTFVYGLLYAREQRLAEEAERALAAAWERTDRRHPWAR